MKNTFTLFVAIVIACILLVYMFYFQVRYDETAIVIKFGKAEAPVHDADGTVISRGSVRDKPDLYFRWPWPFQRVRVYSTRVQLLEDQLQQQLTSDNKNVIIRTFVAWKIDDPRKFYLKELLDIEDAEPHLRPLLKDIRGIISQYRFDQLVNTDASKLKLVEIEEKAKKQIAARLADRASDDGSTVPGYGIEIVRVGIQRIVLPSTTTEHVFGRMKEVRERLAQKARSEGKAEADAIRSKAESASQRILAFTDRSAQAIMAKGDEEAASAYVAFAADEDFAIFLRQIEAMTKTLPYNSTFLLDTNSVGAVKMFIEGPGSIDQTKSAKPE